MKEDISNMIRKYVEGDLNAEDLDTVITENFSECSFKRGQSVWLPSADAFEGMKFGYAELSRLYCDFKSKRISSEAVLLLVDLITMNREILADDGSIFIDEIEGIGTLEDLEAWRDA